MIRGGAGMDLLTASSPTTGGTNVGYKTRLRLRAAMAFSPSSGRQRFPSYGQPPDLDPGIFEWSAP